jgi:hypothetical protein
MLEWQRTSGIPHITYHIPTRKKEEHDEARCSIRCLERHVTGGAVQAHRLSRSKYVNVSLGRLTTDEITGGEEAKEALRIFGGLGLVSCQMGTHALYCVPPSDPGARPKAMDKLKACGAYQLKLGGKQIGWLSGVYTQEYPFERSWVDSVEFTRETNISVRINKLLEMGIEADSRRGRWRPQQTQSTYCAIQQRSARSLCATRLSRGCASPSSLF